MFVFNTFNYNQTKLIEVVSLILIMPRFNIVEILRKIGIRSTNVVFC